MMRRKRREPDSTVDPTNDDLNRMSKIMAEGLKRRARALGMTLDQYVVWTIATKREKNDRDKHP